MIMMTIIIIHTLTYTYIHKTGQNFYKNHILHVAFPENILHLEHLLLCHDRRTIHSAHSLSSKRTNTVTFQKCYACVPHSIPSSSSMCTIKSLVTYFEVVNPLTSTPEYISGSLCIHKSRKHPFLLL